jgi:hypothetical protein
MLPVPKMMVATLTTGPLVRAFPHACGTPMSDQLPSPAARSGDEPEPAAIQAVLALAGAELGLAVAREVMRWRSDHEQYTDCWVDAEGKLTGYYYGHPFSPYRDRNALAEVWKRLDGLGLRERYLACIGLLLQFLHGETRRLDAWTLHTCDTELACRAALLAVRMRG